MTTTLQEPVRTFIQATEVWVPEGDRLVLGGGGYGDLHAFAEVSGGESFGHGEGLPGRAWAEARPIVLKGFEGSYFKRIKAAREAGLTAAVAIPVFAGKELKAVLVTLCGDDAERVGAIEIWAEGDGLLKLDDGYYGAAHHFEFASRHTSFPRGQGLPGGVWASATPMLMRNLGTSYRFIRSESAGEAGITTGLALPVPVPGEGTYILTLLSALGTPLARRFEIWDARPNRVGRGGGAVLSDGICAREGPLWHAETERTATPWQGGIGQVLGTGRPLVEAKRSTITAGYDQMVALPIHSGGALSHVVAWYC